MANVCVLNRETGETETHIRYTSSLIKDPTKTLELSHEFFVSPDDPTLVRLLLLIGTHTVSVADAPFFDLHQLDLNNPSAEPITFVIYPEETDLMTKSFTDSQ